MLARFRSPLLLTVLGLVFFLDLVLHPAQVLYQPNSDFPDLHVPAKRFLVSSLHATGEIPLWCPCQMAGSAFVHDIQAGIFYPPHLLLYALPADYAGAAASWLVVLHVLIAGWSALAYARFRGLGEGGALVVGLGTMFAGRWLLHLLGGGHYVVIGLAWIPLLLLLLEGSLHGKFLLRASGAGVVFAFIILGTHPQWTFYTGLFVVLWTLGAALEMGGWWGGDKTLPLSRSLLFWLGGGALAVLVGVGLSSVQLLPTAEAAGLAMRSRGVEDYLDVDGKLRPLLFLVGPSLIQTLPYLEWEGRGGLTLLWLMAAVLGVWTGRNRTRFEGLVVAFLVLYAVGGSALLQGLPGFRLFRLPSRMFILVGFPLAFLAGRATDALFTHPQPATARRARGLLVQLLIFSGLLLGLSTFLLRSGGGGWKFSLYWPSLALTVPAMLFLLSRLPASNKAAPWLWSALLVADLWALTAPLARVRPEADLFPLPGSLAPLADKPQGSPDSGRVLDKGTNAAFPLGYGAPLARVHRLEALRGYNPLDYGRYKEFLQLAGGSTEPLHSCDGPLTYPVLGDFPVEHKCFLDLLSTRYLVLPTGAEPPPGWVGPKATDEGSHPFNFEVGGCPELPPYALYENPDVLPRAFVVFHTAPLPAEPAGVLAAFRATDFRQTVLLEGEEAHQGQRPSRLKETRREASVDRYEPNRVIVEVKNGPPGWLILSDVWYPGWRCQIDGEDVPVRRGNYLFRAVPVPARECRVVFTFSPASYATGRKVSLMTVGLVLLLGLAGLAFPWRRSGQGWR